jgi:hypothetical protein
MLHAEQSALGAIPAIKDKQLQIMHLTPMRPYNPRNPAPFQPLTVAGAASRSSRDQEQRWEHMQCGKQVKASDHSQEPQSVQVRYLYFPHPATRATRPPVSHEHSKQSVAVMHITWGTVGIRSYTSHQRQAAANYASHPRWDHTAQGIRHPSNL